MPRVGDVVDRGVEQLPARILASHRAEVYHVVHHDSSQPVTVSIDVPQDRASVYAYLDVMANHEPFTDHMLTNWRVSGPPTGIGSKANVTAKVGAITDESEIEVFEVEDGRMIRERSDRGQGQAHRARHLHAQRPPGRRHPHRVRVRAAEGAGDRAAVPAADAQDGPQGQRARDGAPRRPPQRPSGPEGRLNRDAFPSARPQRAGRPTCTCGSRRAPCAPCRRPRARRRSAGSRRRTTCRRTGA